MRPRYYTMSAKASRARNIRENASEPKDMMVQTRLVALTEVPMNTRISLALFGSVAIGFLAFFHAAPARAADVETSVSPVCDTQSQVERLARLIAYNANSAVHAVNTEAQDPRACGIANVAYLRGARVGTVRTQEATFEIVEVLVVGIVSEEGVKATKPRVYFSLLKIDERAV